MKFIIKLTTAALALATLTACGTNNDKPADATRQIRIATESNFKPFSYLDTQGNVVGFEIDLANALCEQIKAQCNIISQDWDSLIPSLNANQSDAIMAGMSITQERQQVVDFSEPYFDNALVLVGKKGDATTIDSIAGKTVATQQATLAADYLKQNHPDAIVKAYDKQDNAHLDLSAGRADLMLSDAVPITDWLSTETGANFEIKGQPIDINDKVAIAVRKGDTALKADFDNALAALKQNGKYDEIVSKYFDKQTLLQK
ncbi:amino acid ABC transporter substrate-binding protein, PAAT family [Moraxella cuniculi DSM 21768]|uniref:Amino acid ABC transporter substrate-binding protein, PAAT family n=1 Tax=Moraxella cuniculi DSM 21768 TaxID=1122245 RepID=A0A1N7ECI0_9GAMM|nr:transporter substrate-binding domain-containing protein [Moraxella cuniculi]OOS05358.1 ABC transporter substrate-binding protein [Moraxella cuniculi]SIR85719.1 amino acid ABC transporter substrate-binding protein, PAAT family [Moraxella cuniculi DSM 21768]